MNFESLSFRPAPAIMSTLIIATFALGTTGCGQPLERCGSDTAGSDRGDPSDFTMALSGSLVLEVARWCSHPMQDLWLEYLSPGPDPDENDSSTDDPKIDEGPPVVTTPQRAVPTPAE